MTLTLPLNAVSAATINQTTTVDSVQFDKSNSSTQTNTTDNNYETPTTSTQTNTTTTDTSTINSTRYEGTDSSTSNSGTEIAAGSALAAGSTTIIKVLIYSGTYAATSCVNGLKTALNYANTNNLLSGIQFTYGTSTVINAATLSGYDVLYMPGGSGGWYYLNSGNIDGTAIKNFVANGGGYLGICAGAYAAVATVDGWYSGWGIAPHVNAKVVNYEGTTTMQITSAGQEVLGRSGTVTVAHYNGAAMYTISSGAKIFATYADSKTGYNGYADIVGDYYGNGRTVLIGSHPELSPQYPDILANLIAWAANVQETDPDPDPGSVTLSQVATASTSVKSFFESNKRLPNYVTINNNQITMPQLLYLVATATNQINSGSTSAISIQNVNDATSSSGSIKSGSILKSEFVSIAQTVISYINTNGKAPNYVSTSLGNMSYENVVYMLSKIMNYYQTNNRLPNFVTMTASSSSNNNTTTPTTVTMSQVGSAATTVKSYYESNKALPSSVTINSQSVSMASLLNLLTTATIQANSGSNTAITLKTVNAATSYTGSIKSGNIQKSEFLTIAQTIITYINTNGKPPSYVSTSLGNMNFNKVVYMFSKIMNYYQTNNRLPNYVSMA
ncbi:MAG: BPL-N domain-containing protein [Methanobacterium sp.]|nr:BPL-N domain-containing protein [Methanobacterium sp.]